MRLNQLSRTWRLPSFIPSPVGNFGFLAFDHFVRDWIFTPWVPNITADRFACMAFAFDSGSAVFHLGFFGMGMALFLFTSVASARHAISPAIAHGFRNSLVLCFYIRQKNVLAIFKRSTDADVFTPGVNAEMDRLCSAWDVIFQLDHKRMRTDRYCLALLKKVADPSGSS